MKHNITYLFLIALFASCTETAGWIDEMQVTPKLVVNALWSTDTPQEQYLELRMTGKKEVRRVSDKATFQMTVNGKAVDAIYAVEYSDIYTSSTSDDGLYFMNYDFHPGDNVSLMVQVNGNTVTAETQVPHTIEIAGVDTLHVVKYDRETKTQDHYIRFLIHLRQPSEMRGSQYFRLALNTTTTCYEAFFDRTWDNTIGRPVFDNIVDRIIDYKYSTSIYDYDADIALKGSEHNVDDDDSYFEWSTYPKNVYGLFNNSVFKKGEYTLCVDVENKLPGSYSKLSETDLDDFNCLRAGYESQFCIEVYTLTRMEYYYLNALTALANYDSGELTSLPPVVPSNIEGGAGIFCISAKASATITEGPGPLLNEGDEVPGLIVDYY